MNLTRVNVTGHKKQELRGLRLRLPFVNFVASFKDISQIVISRLREVGELPVAETCSLRRDRVKEMRK
jgi:hypothetical protein